MLLADVSYHTVVDSQNHFAQAKSAEHGAFALPTHAGDNGRFEARFQDDVSEYLFTKTLSISAGEVINLGGLDLLPLIVLRGTVYKDGAPVVGAYLQLMPMDGFNAMSDENGRFRFRGTEREKIIGGSKQFFDLIERIETAKDPLAHLPTGKDQLFMQSLAIAPNHNQTGVDNHCQLRAAMIRCHPRRDPM